MPDAHQLTARPSDLNLAVDDFVRGLKCFPIWGFLAWNEIKGRYRRTVIGPFWITLNNAIMVFTMGPLYGGLFHQELKNYFTYLSTSIVVWGLIASFITESSTVFIGAEGFIKQIRLPLSAYVFKNIFKNLIVFLHNFVVVLVVFLFYPPPMGLWLLFVPVGIFLLCLNAIWVGVTIGLVCTRFRDIPQIVTSFMGVAFFLTPVMWQANMLGNYAWLAQLNPLYHFMDIVRGPLIRNELSFRSLIVVLAITVVGYIFMFVLFKRFRARVAYWL